MIGKVTYNLSWEEFIQRTLYGIANTLTYYQYGYIHTSGEVVYFLTHVPLYCLYLADPWRGRTIQ